MTTISTSLNQLLASNFSEVGRAAQAQSKPTEDMIAAQLRSGFRSVVSPGSSITAQYQYTVDRSGRLIPTNSSFLIENKIGKLEDALSDQARQQHAKYYAKPDDRPQSFAHITKPKPVISPAEELRLYADSSLADEAAQPEVTASDEDGTPVEVEVFTPQGQQVSTKIVDLAKQLQQKVSSLYAHNSDIIYNVEPALQFAA